MTLFFKGSEHFDFIKNSGKLFISGVLSQLIGFAIYPILTRYFYCQADIGLLRVFMSIVNIVVLLSTAEYQNAIPLPFQKKEATALLHLCFLYLLGTTLLLYILMPVFILLTHHFNKETFDTILWIIPLMAFFMGSWQILLNWHIRNKQFNNIARYQVGTSLFSALGKCLFGLMHAAFGLIYGLLMGSILGLLISSNKKNRLFLKIEKEGREEIKQVAKKYKNFPLFSLPKSLLNSVSTNLPEFALTGFFGTYMIGLWGMSMTLAFTPVSLLSRSFYQVLFEKMTRNFQQKQPLFPILKQFITWDLIFVVPVCLLLYPFLPQITQFLLGDGWAVSGVYIRYMLPWLCLLTITSSINFLPDIFSKQRQLLYFEISSVILRLTVLIFGIFQNSFALAIGLYAFVSFLVLFAQLVWFIFLVRRYDKNTILPPLLL